jgi:hypothetical protein
MTLNLIAACKWMTLMFSAQVRPFRRKFILMFPGADYDLAALKMATSLTSLFNINLLGGVVVRKK